jgi:Flp pilus assembly protein TadG
MGTIRQKLSAPRCPLGQLGADNSSVWERVRHRRDEVGAALAVWLVVAAVPIGYGLTGYIYDGGNVREAQQMAYRTAEKAARLAADQLSTASLRSDGDVAVDPTAAEQAGGAYLDAAGLDGSVAVDGGGTVTVTVVDTVDMKVLSGIGVDAVDIEESASAESINADTEPGDVR